MLRNVIDLNEASLPVIAEIGKHMPGGFFIYRDGGELLYANRAVFDIYGCADLDEFKELTGFTFKGMLHPEDFDEVDEALNAKEGGRGEEFDHVEYRIVRKDGEVRWVEDHGHYAESAFYGGIHFVFVSDVTEKRLRMEEDTAIRQAVIEALSKAYHTVWLIRDVETERFSLYRGDVVGGSTHAMPNADALTHIKYSQAKAVYIDTMVAPEDRMRLHEELKLENLAARASEKEQFLVNYKRLMEDGSTRYYQIEFARIDMPDGKMGIVCGFKDIDESMREAEEIRIALEEKLALHERIAEQEKKSLQETRMITALASDYFSVYYIDLDADEGQCYQAHAAIDDGFAFGDQFKFCESFVSYANRYVTDQYRDEFLAFVQPDNIRQALMTQRVISFRYLVTRSGREAYEMVKFAGVRHPEDRDDNVVHAVGACFADVDEETRKSLAQSEALSDALSSAKQANQAKTAFLSNMSHEIRTPMNAIIGLNNIAMNDPETSGKAREYLNRIDTSAKHLLSIINDILDMSRIESGRMVIKSEEFSFPKLLEQVNAIISGQCRDKGLEYKCSVTGDVLDCYIGDDMKLRQVLVNILGNAVKFTPEGGIICFDIQPTARFDGKSTLKFTIADTGIGMSAEYLPHIFETFSQEDMTAAANYGSTGLGMPITKSIVELMNGAIEVTSEKGVGTTFVVTVTLGESSLSASEAHDASLEPHEMSVLVIDDDPIACEHAQVVLGQIGVSCLVASSGPEGIEIVKVHHARREDFDLILVDWRMPEMDGLEATRQIREIVGTGTPVIILTSYDWADIEEPAKQAGVDSFVAKPLFASSVIEEFRSVYAQKNKEALDSRANLIGCHILLAEDMEVNAEIMMMVLSLREMEADLATDGEKAVELFANSAPGYYDAVLMDMRMPVMDGLEATRAIRALDRADAQEVPIIALTANAFDEDVQRSMQAGLNAHLSKPVEPEILYDTLETLIKK